MVRIYFDDDSDAVYGYKLSEVYDFMWENKICDLEFNLIRYLQKKKIIDKSGKVISNKYGMENIDVKTDKGLFEEEHQKYIFVPIEGARDLVGEIYNILKGD